MVLTWTSVVLQRLWDGSRTPEALPLFSSLEGCSLVLKQSYCVVTMHGNGDACTSASCPKSNMLFTAAFLRLIAAHVSITSVQRARPQLHSTPVQLHDLFMRDSCFPTGLVFEH